MKRTPKQITTDPRAFARYFLKILDKEKQLVPLIWNAAQLDFQAHRTGRDLILKARQLGFSTLVQGELFRRTITSTRTTITLAHDSESTQKLRRMADRFYRHCAFNDIRPARHYANARLSTYPEFDSTAIIATAGSLQVGRGDTYTDMHGSEVAFWPDAEAIVTGAMQGGSPDVILESTPNGAQGYFYERCMEALNGQGVWTLHFYPWWWDADYRLPLEDGERLEYTEEETRLAEQHQLDAAQIKWRRRKQDELRAKFLQEYPEDPYTCFLMSGGSYFGDISQVWTAPLNPAYDPTHRYKAGLDFGQTIDSTAMPILDKTGKAQVALLHINGLEWKEIRRRIVETSDRWSHSTCTDGHVTPGINLACPEPECGKPCAFTRPQITAEKNSIGEVNIELLRDAGLDIIPFETTNSSKAQIMADLHEDLHAGLRLQDIPVQRHELSIFVSTQVSTGVWRLAAEGEGHDDTVIGLALANYENASGWLEFYRRQSDAAKKVSEK
jgi:hypothetical protein